MSKVSKLLQKMRNNPKDFRIEQIETIAKHFQINVRKTGGSHVVLDHPRLVELLTVPARRPIKPIYVKKLLKMIETLQGDVDENN